MIPVTMAKRRGGNRPADGAVIRLASPKGVLGSVSMPRDSTRSPQIRRCRPNAGGHRLVARWASGSGCKVFLGSAVRANGGTDDDG